MNEKNGSKIHLKVGEIEISIEGTPDFVTKQYQIMEKKLNLSEKLTSVLSVTPEKKEIKSGRKKTSKKATTRKEGEKQSSGDFKEWLKNLPKDLKNKDKALAAGYFNQLNSKNNIFRVRDMNNLLKENGISITNPSSLIKNTARNQKIIRQVSREGRQVYYQFTKEGEKYIKNILPGLKK